MKKNYVIGITGASGAILALKLMRHFLDLGYDLDILISQAGYRTLHFEIDSSLCNKAAFLNFFKEYEKDRIRVFENTNVGCPSASGTYNNEGMIIVPCSMATTAAVSIGLADNAIRRSADVTIKEKKPLILVPREAPFSPIHLENLLKLAKLGVIILPPCPQWYLKPGSLDEVENMIVGKVLDILKEPHNFYTPWTGMKN